MNKLAVKSIDNVLTTEYRNPAPKLRKSFFHNIWKQRYLQIMAIPGIVFLLIFNYIPMYGILIAFKEYSVIKGVLGSPWVGLRYFIEFFKSDMLFILLRNTLGLSILNLILGFPVPIIFALLLNELTNRYYKKFVQTVSYLPHFISWVIVGGIFLRWLSVEGLINEVAVRIGILPQPQNFMMEPLYAWMILILTNIWKSFGWGSIIFLAAISCIDQEMYEAAYIDGAGRFKRMWYITIPSILPTVVILFILNVSTILNCNFEQILVMRNSAIRDYTDVIDIYTYDIGIGLGRYSYASAVGLSKAIVSLILLFTSNFVSLKFVGTGLFRGGEK